MRSRLERVKNLRLNSFRQIVINHLLRYRLNHPISAETSPNKCSLLETFLFNSKNIRVFLGNRFVISMLPAQRGTKS